jgi:hypothetical protein
MHAEQIRLLREAGTARRFALMRSLSATVIHLARKAIRDANPDLSERERQLLFVRVHYGEDLAERLRTFLDLRT